MLELIGKTLNCILCRGTILYFDETGFQKFCRHLQYEHSALHDFDFMLAACKMTDGEKNALVSVFNKKTSAPDPDNLDNSKDSEKKNDSEANSVNKSVKKAEQTNFKNQRRKKNSYVKQKVNVTSKGKKVKPKRVGNNIIDVKAFKAKKFNCLTCGKTYASRYRFKEHKAKKHLSVNKQPKSKAIAKKKTNEALKPQMVIGADIADKATEAVQSSPSSSSQSKPPQNPSVPIPEIEIKVESEETVEIVDIVKIKVKPEPVVLFPPVQNSNTVTKPTNETKNQSNYKKLDTIIAGIKSSSDADVNKDPKISEVTQSKLSVETTAPLNNSSNALSNSEDSASISDPQCKDCIELASNTSKFNRHRRYVHGSGYKSDSPKTESLGKQRVKLRDNPISPQTSNEVNEEAKNSTDNSAKSAETKDDSSISETPLKSCLKRTKSIPRKLSVSFNEKISFSGVEVDCVNDENVDNEPSSKKSRGRPKKLNLAEPTLPAPCKRAAEEVMDVVGTDTNEPPAKKLKSKSSSTNNEMVDETKLPRESTKLTAVENPKETKVSVAPPTAVKPKIEKQKEEIKEDKVVNDASKQVPKDVPKPSKPKMKTPVNNNPTGVQKSPGVPNIFILRQCENCPEMFANSEQLKNHVCALENQQKDEVIVENSQQAKTQNDNLAHANLVTEEKEPILMETLDEEAVVIEDTVNGFEMKENIRVVDPKPNIVAPRFVIDKKQIVNVQNGPAMLNIPYDSFLETVLVEETNENKILDQIENFRADLWDKGGDNLSAENPGTGEAVVITGDNFDNLGPLDKLLFKYRRPPKCVDFTKSNFFMKNAELIGGKGTGSGFKESVKFLPEGWKVKSFNEYKRFFFTPECIVLKSCTAVIEYLRLKYDLAQEDLKTLSEELKISKNVFNRYLDELFDDCVVLE